MRKCDISLLRSGRCINIDFSRALNLNDDKRIQYILDDVEIDIDTWPKIPTYLEIEGKDKESVNKIIKKLNIDESKISTLDVQSLYEYYGYDGIHDLKFEEE